MSKKLEKIVVGNKFTEKLLTDKRFRKKSGKIFFTGVGLIGGGSSLYYAINHASNGEYGKAALVGIFGVVLTYICGKGYKKSSEEQHSYITLNNEKKLFLKQCLKL